MERPPLNIMVIAAHPQDPFERAGGAVAKHLARGDRAMLVSLTSGAVTHALDFFPPTGADKLRDIQKAKDMKREECARASQILGAADWRILDFSESPMVAGLPEYITLVNLIREFRPQVVLTSHPMEVGRQDHMDCGRIAIAAVDYARADGFPSPLAPHKVADIFLFYYQDFRAEQLMGTSRGAPSVIVDITAVVAKKRAAMTVFEMTQARKGEDYEATMDRFFASIDGAVGFLHGMGYAEQFTRWNPERVQYLPVAG